MIYTPPLALYFVWNFANNSEVTPILDRVRKTFARDVDLPFSRELNIPLFFYSTLDMVSTPEKIKKIAIKNIIFLFISKYTLGYENWKEYIENIGEGFTVIPIALDPFSLKHTHSGRLKNSNAIRAYDWETKLCETQLSIQIAHEVYRYGFHEICSEGKGKDYSLKLFLSHSKKDSLAKQSAKELQAYISQTNMNSFFDAIEISPGFDFTKEITKHLDESTLLVLYGDTYSTRYWCKKEVFYSKSIENPIITIDCRESHEDRIFPAVVNMPCVHLDKSETLGEEHILRILETAILETIRYRHAKNILSNYGKCGWLPSNSFYISTPPDIHNIRKALHNYSHIFYPDPPLHKEELEWVDSINSLLDSSSKDKRIVINTPLEYHIGSNNLDNLRVGISISESNNTDFSKIHTHDNQLKRLSQDLARYLFSCNATILYGGDLRKGGFTEFILDEAEVVQDRYPREEHYVKNYLAWPIYLKNEDVVDWNARYDSLVEVESVEPPETLLIQDKTIYLPQRTIESKYIWSRCLTNMREKIIAESDVRICAGGKFFDYSGKMPGVLEEVMIALEKEKPLYLFGGFGGVTGEVVDIIINQAKSTKFSEDWQIEKNIDYGQLQEHSGENYKADYEDIKSKLEALDVKLLAQRAGLEVEEYRRLMLSPFIDECIYLLLKGLKQITTDKQN